eukprot:5441227-Amphidinium_carterae.1
MTRAGALRLPIVTRLGIPCEPYLPRLTADVGTQKRFRANVISRCLGIALVWWTKKASSIVPSKSAFDDSITVCLERAVGCWRPYEIASFADVLQYKHLQWEGNWSLTIPVDHS